MERGRTSQKLNTCKKFYFIFLNNWLAWYKTLICLIGPRSKRNARLLPTGAVPPFDRLQLCAYGRTLLHQDSMSHLQFFVSVINFKAETLI
jgi:hypothetical protein